MPLVECWFDGCVAPVNPSGHGSYGILVKVDSVVVHATGHYVGHGDGISNNVCEYKGVVSVLQYLLDNQLYGETIIRGDSKLVIMQLSGQWKVHKGAYVPVWREAKYLLVVLRERVKETISLEWIPREMNSETDVLSKGVLQRMGVRIPEYVKV